MIGRRDFDALMDAYGRLERVLLSVLAERNRTLTEHLVELLFVPVDQRMLCRLLGFSEAVSPKSRDGCASLSQAELATLAGTTRSTVNRVLRRAEELGLVELARGRIRLADEPGLRHRASR